jgi:hypothetical protein
LYTLKNRSEILVEPLAARPAADARAPRQRSAVTNGPMRRTSGNTAAGRRVRDLYRAFLQHMTNPADTIAQANALNAAELTVAAENARTKLLAGQGDIEQIVRLENLANRAVRRLGIKPGTAPALTIRDRLIAEAEAREASDV